MVSLSDFPDKTRVACRGTQICKLSYVLEERDEGFVIVSGGNYAGWMDPSAAAYESSLGIWTYGVY